MQSILNQYLIPNLSSIIIDYITPQIVKIDSDRSTQYNFKSQLFHGSVYTNLPKPSISYLLVCTMECEMKGTIQRYNENKKQMSNLFGFNKHTIDRRQVIPQETYNSLFFILNKDEMVAKMQSINSELPIKSKKQKKGAWCYYTQRRFDCTLMSDSTPEIIHNIVWLQDVTPFEIIDEIEAIERLLKEKYNVDIHILSE